VHHAFDLLEAVEAFESEANKVFGVRAVLEVEVFEHALRNNEPLLNKTSTSG
jgi:hypothetical protein